ncbi:MAG: DUF1569 domain-containing protein [Gemmatimonadetes bacterium]|nr:DUF1569 domain-containing protein [Gemmatimonadota bacterium]
MAATIHLFDPARQAEVRQRVGTLRADSAARWGKMNVAQATAHMAMGLELALGEMTTKRSFLGRIIGGVVRRIALGDDRPMIQNAPTAAELDMQATQKELDAERARLLAALDRFQAAGRAGITTAPHFFFGDMTPEEWGVLQYKHLDHHLRQFGA